MTPDLTPEVSNFDLERPPPRRPPRPAAIAPDLTTLLGLAAAFGVLVVAMLADRQIKAFLDVTALLLVVGGTLAVTVVSFSQADLSEALQGLGATLVRRDRSARQVVRRVLAVAERARPSDPAVLRDAADGAADLPLLRRGLRLVADGVPADQLERMLTADLEAAADAGERAAGVLRRAAEVAPAMGLIGTLIGLVQMLGKLQDPAAIGPGMAIALLTTFYGAVLGNMILHPLAGKIETNGEADLVVNRLCLIGAVSIARQEGVKRLDLLLTAALPPADRRRAAGTLPIA